MRSASFAVTTPDGTTLATNSWIPDGPAKAIVVVAHGMAEHSARYARFGSVLAEAGYAVYAHDHRGHGQTAGSLDKVGYIGDHGGLGLLVDDLGEVVDRARTEHPGIPVFVLGHSMGTFVVRSYIAEHGADLAGAMLSGTGGDPGLLGKVGRALAFAEAKIRGRRTPSPLMTKLTFGQFNAAFSPHRTEFDWLSRDPVEVDKYVDDPYCGGVFAVGFFQDLLGGLARVNDPKLVARIPPTLPIYLFSGEKDPVGGPVKGVEQVAAAFRAAGMRDVTVRFYTGGRHESFNETNRDEVYADVVAWLDAHLPR